LYGNPIAVKKAIKNPPLSFVSVKSIWFLRMRVKTPSLNPNPVVSVGCCTVEAEETGVAANEMPTFSRVSRMKFIAFQLLAVYAIVGMFNFSIEEAMCAVSFSVMVAFMTFLAFLQ